MVSEAKFPANKGYVCIQKWSYIFVSGTGSARTESEEKVILVSENKRCPTNITLETSHPIALKLNQHGTRM